MTERHGVPRHVRTIDPDLQRFLAARKPARAVELPARHVSPILRASDGTRKAPPMSEANKQIASPH